MNEIDWQLIYHYSKNTIDGMAITIRFGILTVLTFLGVFGGAALVISLKKKKKEITEKKPAPFNILIIAPLIIIAFGLSYCFYQTIRDPYAYHGKVTEKYLHGARKTESVIIEINEAHFFSENGKGKHIDKRGRETVRVTPDLYAKIIPGSEAIILIAADDRGYGQILDGDIQITDY